MRQGEAQHGAGHDQYGGDKCSRLAGKKDEEEQDSDYAMFLRIESEAARIKCRS